MVRLDFRESPPTRSQHEKARWLSTSPGVLIFGRHVERRSDGIGLDVATQHGRYSGARTKLIRLPTTCAHTIRGTKPQRGSDPRPSD
jgi:hypothetical protein